MRFLAKLAAAVAVVATLASAAADAAPAWPSGASGDACLAKMRGAPFQVTNVFPGISSFGGMVYSTSGSRSPTPLRVTSLALLPKTNAGQFAQCAAGRFDGYFRTIGANIARNGAATNIIRLGWEANIGSHAHPWGVDTTAQVPTFKACWRRAAAALKAGGPSLRLEFASTKRTQNPAFKALDLYPGDDTVDVLGVHYYDNGPEKNTQATWDQYYLATFHGGEWGLGTWLAAARAHGKPLGIGEWGIWRKDATTAAQADDPVYIQNMHAFFQKNAASIAYETYFNAIGDEHQICYGDGRPTTFPNAAAAYARLWGGP